MEALVRFVQTELAKRADTNKAAPMAAYMRTAMPFYGVASPRRREVAKEMRARFEPTSNEEYRQQVLTLWSLPHREEKYLALDLAVDNRKFITLDNLDLYERLIREGQWWDLVDEVAARLVGKVWLERRQQVTPVMSGWIDDPDLWIRRTALIGQLGHKQQTDASLLFDFCSRRAHETDFFIRKAIGWALRQYAKTDPDAVRGFLTAHGEKLSGLSRREAAKHL